MKNVFLHNFSWGCPTYLSLGNAGGTLREKPAPLALSHSNCVSNGSSPQEESRNVSFDIYYTISYWDMEPRKWAKQVKASKNLCYMGTGTMEKRMSLRYLSCLSPPSCPKTRTSFLGNPIVALETGTWISGNHWGCPNLTEYQ